MQLETIKKVEQFPLSFSQEYLWFLEQCDQSYTACNNYAFLKLQGSLNCDALIQSIQVIVDYHAPLRTVFKNDDGKASQYVLQNYKFKIPFIDLRNLSEDKKSQAIEDRFKEEQQTRFELDKTPGFRAQVIILSEQEHLLLITFHHLASDSWSLQLFSKELSAQYNALLICQSTPYKRPLVNYTDFVVCQRQHLTDEVLEKHLSYWTDRIYDLPQLELHTDYKRTHAVTFNGASCPIKLSLKLSEKLSNLAREQGVTLYMLLLASFKILLYRYTSQDKIAVGTPIINRPPEVEGLIGFFVNSVVTCTGMGGDPTFIELLMRVKDTVLGAYAHQDLPFERLVAEINPEHHLNRHPLFQVLFALQQKEVLYPSYNFHGLEITQLQLNKINTRFDIEIHLCENNAQIEGYCIFNGDLFKRQTIERMLTHFEVLLNGIADNPKQRISQLPIMTAAEKQMILVDWNNTSVPYPKDKTLHQLFEAQAAKKPNNIAVVCADETLTYQVLNQKANQLARYIRDFYLAQRGEALKAGTLIGLCVLKGLDSIVAILAIIKSGGAYVPIDPTNPKERIEYILKDCNSPFILTQSNIEMDFQLPTIFLNELNLRTYQDDNLDLFSAANDLAYVIYTSGTTGRPKGVMIEHQAVVSLFFSMNEIQIGVNDGFLQISNLAFDASTFEIWGSLLNGARIVIPEDVQDLIGDVKKFQNTLTKHNINILWLTSSLFERLYELDNMLFKNIKYLLIGAEALNPNTVADICRTKNSEQIIINGYGPTEVTVFTTMYNCDEGIFSSVPIGKPIRNRGVYNLDKNLCPLPIGVIGELYISGSGLARGYLNQPELTSERFISNPFISSEEIITSRLYKTGDLVCLREDGNIEYIGRTDFQVKLRGYRIECGEIEVELRKCSLVKNAVVDIVDSEDKKLVAWLVLNENSISPVRSANNLRQALISHLKTSLPDYMIPTFFIILDAIPLTTNGKVDRQALPKSLFNRNILSNEYCPPNTSMEKKLVEIWKDILLIDEEPIGINDNFFELGGHSLLAVQLFAAVEKKLYFSVPVRMISQITTIKEMAEYLTEINTNNNLERKSKIKELIKNISLETLKENDVNTPLDWCDYQKLYIVTMNSKVSPIKSGSLLIGVNQGGGRVPIFWCGGLNEPIAFGGCFNKEQPLYLMSPGLLIVDHYNSDEFIEKLVAHFVEEILIIQPKGPYIIGGNCVGGKVAVQIVLELMKNGHNVQYLLLLEHFEEILFEFSQDMFFLFAVDSHKRLEQKFNWGENNWMTAFKKAPTVKFVSGEHGIFYSIPRIQEAGKLIAEFLEN